jgi:expansin (peptidoglycan-binding protein)
MVRRFRPLAFVGSLFLACSGDDAGAGGTNGGPDGGASSSADGAPIASGEGGPRGDGAPTTGPLSPRVTGIATYYDADGTGACSFDASPNDLDVAAMNIEEWSGSAVCGECVDVFGPSGEVTVRVVDQCPGCKKGHLDLSRQAFAKIAPLSAGRVAIEWQVVPCAVTGPVAYRFKEGSSKYWTAIQVRNHRLPVQKLEYERAGAFVGIRRESYNYFVVPSGVGDTPNGLRVRATAIDGTTLEDRLPGVQEAQVFSGAGQF